MATRIIRSRFLAWLKTPPFADPVEQQQAVLLQVLLVADLVATLLAVPLVIRDLLLGDGFGLYHLGTMAGSGSFLGSALWLLRRGRFRPAVLLTSLGVVLALSISLALVGLVEAWS